MSLRFTPPPAGQKLPLGTHPTTADSQVIAELISPKQPVLVLAANAQDGERLKVELAAFAPTARIVFLPDWETLPYDHFSPHADLVSERLAALWQMRQQTVDVMIVPVTTAMTRLAPVSHLAGRTFLLQHKQKLQRYPARGFGVGGLYPCHTGLQPWGIFGTRRSDRPVPDGRGTALPY